MIVRQRQVDGLAEREATGDAVSDGWANAADVLAENSNAKIEA
jgi:hypothetical protein